jgi:hypothetical protein
MHRRIAILLCALAPLVHAFEREIPYANLHKVFARVAGVPDGKYFKSQSRFESKDPAVATKDIRLVIRSKSGDIPVPIAADGAATFPVRDDLLAENPPVVTNVAKGQLQMRVDMSITAPPEQRFRYDLVVAMIGEVDGIIASQGMMARMFAPDFEGLQLTFAPGTAATATVEAAKPESFQADAEGRIRIPDRKAWRKENPFVQLSALPTRMELYVED